MLARAWFVTGTGDMPCDLGICAGDGAGALAGGALAVLVETAVEE
jgi:hypothetical protein